MRPIAPLAKVAGRRNPGLSDASGRQGVAAYDIAWLTVVADQNILASSFGERAADLRCARPDQLGVVAYICDPAS